MYNGKKAIATTNVWFFIGVLFIFSLFIGGIQQIGSSLLERDLSGQISLSNDSVTYATELLRINTSSYRATKEQLEDPITYNENESEGTPKDFSIQFFFAKERATGITGTIKNIYNLPSYILYTILQLPQTEFTFIVSTIIWLLGLAVTISIVYFILK